MNTLIIKDLAITEELDSKAMAAVHGGFCGYKMPSSCHPYQQYQPKSPSTSSTTVTVDQSNEQYQSNPTGNGSATLGGGIYAWNNQQAGNYVGSFPAH
jgi:hypothetical protein